MLIVNKITRKGRRKMGVRGNNSPECATALPPPSLWIASAVFGIFLAEYVRAATAAARKRGTIVDAQVKLSEARFGSRQHLSAYQPPG